MGLLGRGRARRFGLVASVAAVLLSAGSVALAAPSAAPLLQAWLFEDGRILRGPVPISIGDEIDPTPPGRYQVEWKAEHWVSREYGTPMPWSVFFAPGGIAFHEGSLQTNSAGCIRMTGDNAEAFFRYLQVGDEVQVHSDPPTAG
jgi:lipoprotein-anchoring transpeptidase ErfK/SrfK